jgi:hypothetical protein
MRRPGKNSLVLEHEGDREQQLKTTVQRAKQKLPGSTSTTPKGRDQYIRVEHIGSSQVNS